MKRLAAAGNAGPSSIGGQPLHRQQRLVLSIQRLHARHHQLYWLGWGIMHRARRGCSNQQHKRKQPLTEECGHVGSAALGGGAQLGYAYSCSIATSTTIPDRIVS